jgi:hypothetical protein
MVAVVVVVDIVVVTVEPVVSVEEARQTVLMAGPALLILVAAVPEPWLHVVVLIHIQEDQADLVL